MSQVIKIQHPVQSSKTLLIESDFKVKTPDFEMVTTPSQVVTVYGNSYRALVHDSNKADFNLEEEPEEELYTWLSEFHAPSIDALLRSFLDTGTIDSSDEYKIWLV